MTHEVWKELAGSRYDQLVASKEIALGLLFDADRNVRIAAINVCDSYWKCSSDIEFVTACRKIAALDNDDSVRAHAIRSLGTALRSSKERLTSGFLANLVTDEDSSDEVRKAAYWALREIQFGLTEEDVVKRSISLMRLAMRSLSTEMTEDDVKAVMLCNGRFPETTWGSADQIDWDFVKEHASEK